MNLLSTLLLKKRLEKLTDSELVDHYKSSRDGQYLGEVFQRYTHLVLGVSLKYLGNEEDSKDAVMEVYLQLNSSLLEHDVSNFKNWLYSVTKNHCLMRLRKAKQMPFSNLPPEELKNLDLFMENPEFLHLVDKDGTEVSRNDIYNALKTLKDEQRTCIVLFYLEGKRYQEIEEMTGYSSKQIKSYIQNGKRNLRNIFLEQGE